VIYELAVAARTDEKLRETLRTVMATYIAKIHETVRPLIPHEFEALGEENFVAMFTLVRTSFDGAALFRHLGEVPGFEERQIPLLVSLLGARVPAM